MTVRDALNSAIDEEMAADSKVFIIGEEVRIINLLRHDCRYLSCVDYLDVNKSTRVLLFLKLSIVTHEDCAVTCA